MNPILRDIFVLLTFSSIFGVAVSGLLFPSKPPSALRNVILGLTLAVLAIVIAALVGCMR